MYHDDCGDVMRVKKRGIMMMVMVIMIMMFFINDDRANDNGHFLLTWVSYLEGYSYIVVDDDDEYYDLEDNGNVEYADAKDDDCNGDENRPISGSAIWSQIRKNYHKSWKPPQCCCSSPTAEEAGEE